MDIKELQTLLDEKGITMDSLLQMIGAGQTNAVGMQGQTAPSLPNSVSVIPPPGIQLSTSMGVKDIDDLLDRGFWAVVNSNPIDKMLPQDVANCCIEGYGQEISLANAVLGKGEKHKPVHRLVVRHVAWLLLNSGLVDNIKLENTTRPATYISSGKDYGLYRPCMNKYDDGALRNLARAYSRSLTQREFEEVKSYIEDKADEHYLTPTQDKRYIAVDNGVYNLEDGSFMDWDKAKENKIVFLSKLAVKFNPNAQNKKYYDEVNDRYIDIDILISEICGGDPDRIAAVWDAMHMMICANDNSIESAVLIVDPHFTGDNGKSTIGFICQQLYGDGHYSTMGLEDMSGDFALQSLPTVNAIISTDSDDTPYIESSGNFKKLASNEPVRITVKYGQPIEGYHWHGKMWHTFNGFPRFKDVSTAIDKRFYIIDFNTHFTKTKNPKIKTEFLCDPEVLEYILLRLLKMGLKKPTEYPFQRGLKRAFRSATNPVDAFLDELTDPEERESEALHWQMYPVEWLYDAFRGWYQETYNKGAAMSKPVFLTSARFWVEKHSDEWEIPLDKDGNLRKVAPSGMMDNPEIFSESYNHDILNNMAKWLNPYASGSHDLGKRCTLNAPAKQYRCMRRVKTQ